MPAKDIPDSRVAKWIQLAASILILPVLGWGIFMERRVTALEADHLTAKDAIAIYDRLQLKADRAEVPPPVVIQRLDRLESDVAEVKADVKTLLRRAP